MCLSSCARLVKADRADPTIRYVEKTPLKMSSSRTVSETRAPPTYAQSLAQELAVDGV